MSTKLFTLMVVFFWVSFSIVLTATGNSSIKLRDQEEIIFDVTVHPAVEDLRCLLVGEGFLAEKYIKGHDFDWFVFLAVKELQKQSGLKSIGNVRKATLSRLISNQENWKNCTESPEGHSASNEHNSERTDQGPTMKTEQSELKIVPRAFLLDPEYHNSRKHDAFLRSGMDVDFKRILQKYKNIVETSAFPKIDPVHKGIFFQRGQKSEVVGTLCKRLALEHFINSDDCSKTYDVKIQRAFYTFKRGHQLVVNDLLGKRVIRVLNVSAQAKYEALLSSYQQFSKGFTPEKLSQLLSNKPYLVANVPAGRVQLVLNEQVWEYRAIMGTVARETPQFSDHVYSITLHPTWTPTVDYRNKNLHKKFLNDPSLIKESGFYVFDEETDERLPYDKYNYKGTWIRRIPGADNPLGLMRMNTLNDQAIFLHSTSELELFDKVDRYFSAGCIRVEGIGDLAANILNFTDTIPGSKELDLVEMLELYEGGSEAGETINLRDKVPFFVIPYTAWPDKGGVSAQFRDDPYNG